MPWLCCRYYMSRRFLFILAALVVMLYFSVILIMLNPMHTTRNLRIGFVKWCKPLGWRVPPGPIVALASFPGSGNTWLRYLLQQSTGILTGSIYNDQSLVKHGFPAEEVKNGSVLVFKTHEPFRHLVEDWDLTKKVEIQSAILLIRNPRDAILADFNRLFGGHIGTAPKKVFNKLTPIKAKFLKRPDWSTNVDGQIAAWEFFHKTWLNEFDGPLHIVFYEDLVRDVRRTLRGIFDFLHVQVTEDDLDCTLRNREGIYRRRHKHKDFDPFTPSMMEKIEKVRRKVLEAASHIRPLTPLPRDMDVPSKH